jgi:hypothetical protein
MMGGIGKAHTIRQALLHAPKVQTELSLILPPLSSPSLPKVVQYSRKNLCDIALWNILKVGK